MGDELTLALAPMEGLVDDVLRDVLTSVGGIDWCVTEFVRVNDSLLPPQVFHRIAPELGVGARTSAGVPVRVQLLGSDPDRLAENALRAVELGAPVIDLNFGCPARTVNKSRGGAVLLDEPELLDRILAAIRAVLPTHVPVTAKIRLGFNDRTRYLDCAEALVAAGCAELVVHARSKADGYRPPAYWHYVGELHERFAIPVYANGEIWSVAVWRRCRAETGCTHFMLGRGLVALPDLARQIRAEAGAPGAADAHLDEAAVVELIQRFWARIRAKVPAAYAPGRLKQWLNWLQRNYSIAERSFKEIRRETDARRLDVFVASLECGRSVPSADFPLTRPTRNPVARDAISASS